MAVSLSILGVALVGSLGYSIWKSRRTLEQLKRADKDFVFELEASNKAAEAAKKQGDKYGNLSESEGGTCVCCVRAHYLRRTYTRNHTRRPQVKSRAGLLLKWPANK